MAASFISSLHALSILSPLECLPLDLAYMIVDYVPEAEYKLRLVSKATKRMVDAHCLLQQNIPVIEELTLSFNGKFMNLAMIAVNRKLLRRRLVRDLSFRLVDRIRIVHGNCGELFRLECVELQEVDVLLEYLNGTTRSFGSVILQECCTQRQLCSVSKLLAGMQFATLTFSSEYLTKGAEKFLIETIPANNVDMLILSTEALDSEEPGEILIALSRLIRSLRISHLGEYRAYSLLGMDPDVLALTISDMFEQRLDKLDLLYSDYCLDADTTNILMERLPNIENKTIWFVALAEDMGSMKYEELDHIIEVNRGVPSTLSIKHTSRLDEPFM